MRSVITALAVGLALATVLGFGPPRLTNSAAYAQSCGPKHQACLERCKQNVGTRGIGRCASNCADRLCKK
jgi:hypothetical protein